MLSFRYEEDYVAQTLELTEDYIREMCNPSVPATNYLSQLDEDESDNDYNEYLEVIEDANEDNSRVGSANGDLESEDHTSVEIVFGNEEENKSLEACIQQVQSNYRKIRPKGTILEAEKEEEQETIVFDLSGENNDYETVFIVTDPSEEATTAVGSGEQEYKTIQVIGTSTENCGLKCFFDSMAQTINRLPPNAQTEVKKEICKAVTEAEIKHSSHESNSFAEKSVKQNPNNLPKLVLIPCSLIDKT